MNMHTKRSGIATIVGRFILLLPGIIALCLTLLIHYAHNLALHSKQLFAWTLLFGLPWNAFFESLLAHVHVGVQWVDNSMTFFELIWGPAILHTLFLFALMRIGRLWRKRSRSSAP